VTVTLAYEPPTTDLPDGSRAVPVDVEHIEAELAFDVGNRTARCRARVHLMASQAGHPVLDLRQIPAEVRLDGRLLDGEAFPRRDLGGGPDAEVRVLREPVQPGPHVLEIDYPIATPEANGALPVQWVDGGVRFDLWMSDLYPGRYLEMWIPANLCHDRFALRITVAVTGTDRPHSIVANGAVRRVRDGFRFDVRYPPSYTALSPMLVLSPADELVTRRSVVAIPGRMEPLRVIVGRHAEVDADLAAVEADIHSWLVMLSVRYGPWAHEGTFHAVVWAPGRGMEYDGATTAALGAMEHEVFHSWFGRGVKPAVASDGWIDEAFTSWATSSRRREGPRFSEEPLDLDAPPVLLYPPHPWSRFTPGESYSDGAALFGALAAVLGGAGPLRSAMASWYRANSGGLVTTAGLQAHLTSWSGTDVGSWFDRFVHGVG
jgi:hypothetical protein